VSQAEHILVFLRITLYNFKLLVILIVILLRRS